MRLAKRARLHGFTTDGMTEETAIEVEGLPGTVTETETESETEIELERPSEIQYSEKMKRIATKEKLEKGRKKP